MVENRFDLALVAYALGRPQWGGGLAGVVVIRGVLLEPIDIKNVVDLPLGREVRDLECVFTVLFTQGKWA